MLWQCKVSMGELPLRRVKANDMPIGSLGISERGLVYYRTIESVTCLSEAERSYSGHKTPAPDNLMVKLFKAGETVTLTQV